MQLTPLLALDEAETLTKAAADVHVPQLAAHLRARAREWKDAADAFTQAEDIELSPSIELAGTVEVGMRLYLRRQGSVGVVRVLGSNGAPSHQVVDDEGYMSYVNYVAPSSPVVVLL